MTAIETARAKKQAKELATLRQAYVEGPVVVLPVSGDFNFGFDPNGVASIDANSTIYRSLKVSDDWGLLEAHAGMIVRENGLIKRVVVPAAEEGKAWKLDPKPGFKLEPGPREGDRVLHCSIPSCKTP